MSFTNGDEKRKLQGDFETRHTTWFNFDYVNEIYYREQKKKKKKRGWLKKNMSF